MEFCTLGVLILNSMGSQIQIGQALLIKSQHLDVFSLGSGAVTWTSKKQQAVSLFSTEAEYIGIVKAGCEVVWLRRMLGDMQMSPTGPTTLFVDNEGVIKLAQNPVFHERTKHVDVHCHYIRQLVEDGTIDLQYVPTTDQTADILTKPLGCDKFVKFRGHLGVLDRLTIKGGYYNNRIVVYYQLMVIL